VVQNLYKIRFLEQPDHKVRLDNVVFSSIDKEDNDLLVSSFSEEEIRAAIWDCEGSKSPGPDGFNFNFFKQF